MEHGQSPLRTHIDLTPALLEAYMARARAERAKAIAEFSRHIAAWALRTAARLAPHARRARHTAKPQTAR